MVVDRVRGGLACASIAAATPEDQVILRIGVLVSGAGTNLQALLEACAEPDFPARVALVGCNRAEARRSARATEAGVPCCVADRGVEPKRARRQAILLESLRAHSVDLVVLAGFDEILVPEFVAAYTGRILNTHPSLLPAFGGTMHAVDQALEHGVKVTGCTIHLVTDDLDGGPILLQAVRRGARRRRRGIAARAHPRAASTACCRWPCALLPKAACTSRAAEHA